MTDTPRYYQPLEIPAFCFLWEAVMWVTFGRFPEGNGYYDMGELKDELGMLSFAWKDSFGGPRYRFKGFWWFEGEMAGVDLESVDWQRYEGALRAGYQRIDTLEAQIKYAEQSEKHDLSTYKDEMPALVVDRAKLYRELCENQLADYPFVEGIHRQYQQSIDRGWSLIFQALVDGKVQAYGWGDMTQDEIRKRAAEGGLADYEPSAASAGNDGNVLNPWHAKLPEPDLIGPLLQMGAHTAIPRKEWSLGGVAPDGRYVTAAGRNWWDVCLTSDQLFELFPRPLLVSDVVDRDSIEVVNPGLAIGGASGSAMTRHINPTAASRGRKKLADGEIERACQALYGQRWEAGEEEAPLHAEAKAFALQVWGENLARSTFQGYMKPFRRPPKMMPDRVPVIAAA